MRSLLEKEGLKDRIELDSAGTGSWHVGEPPDVRATETGAARGIELTGAARQFRAADFDRFDYVIAMDRSNRKNILKLAKTAEQKAKVHLFRSFDPSAEGREEDTPDPYYGGPDGFERVFDICESACRGLLDHVRREHGL